MYRAVIWPCARSSLCTSGIEGVGCLVLRHSSSQPDTNQLEELLASSPSLPRPLIADFDLGLADARKRFNTWNNSRLMSPSNLWSEDPSKAQARRGEERSLFLPLADPLEVSVTIHIFHVTILLICRSVPAISRSGKQDRTLSRVDRHASPAAAPSQGVRPGLRPGVQRQSWSGQGFGGRSVALSGPDRETRI